MKNLKISVGLISVIAVFTMMLMLSSGLGLYFLKNNNQDLKKLNNNANEQKALNLTRNAFVRARALINTAAQAKIHQERVDIPKAQAEAQAELRIADEQFGNYLKIPGLDQTYPELGVRMQKAYDQQKATLTKNVGSLTADAETLRQIVINSVATTKKTSQNWEKVYQEYIGATQASLDKTVEQSNSSYHFAVVMMSVMLAVAIILFFTTHLWLRKILVRPLQTVALHFDEIGKGDLTGDIHVENRNEIGLLCESLQQMQAGLKETVTSIRQGAESINIGTQEIASGNGDLSSRTEQQAAAVVETAASMEQISSTVKLNTDNARLASTMFQDTASIASEGEVQMQGMMEKMTVISQSAQKMVDIISVIDGIAFQTNILALNAAVEAARAGQSGRGFAVVAGEVRNLAKRCTDSAKEISTLINESTQYIVEGTELADKTSKVIVDISSAVGKANAMMENIAQASEEQNRGVEQIRVAITQMDEVTQQNAALVEEVAVTAQGVEGQANLLARAVSTFKLSPGY
ncbi:methyl-accepting chemotaxis protein [Enterobacteriaceae bacterium H11S18]|uniref:methyl-accepting chemotaxis protein n=1 Tax=Dryocola clanedunensis TaxID=2925396 RepID=UPI0022F0C4F9|nr:methyl-accepting chemotaxis protein [Dryocola clanedunensis]MCT4710423.1 methyl-accepting chemotaxis protein [Dryocola clanedunensis]